LSGNRANRGALTDLQGNVVRSSNPAKVGGTYSIWLTGMGVFPDGKPSLALVPTMLITNIPGVLIRFDADPNSVWQRVTLDYVGASSQYPGLYQINFELPIITSSDAQHPSQLVCADYNWEVSIDLSQSTDIANLIRFLWRLRLVMSLQ
jgi:uncharacterized protein (TIGR03437 family)